MSKNSRNDSVENSGTPSSIVPIAAILLSVLSMAAVLMQMFLLEEGSSLITIVQGATILFPIVVIFLLVKILLDGRKNSSGSDQDGAGSAQGDHSQFVDGGSIKIGFFKCESDGNFDFVSDSVHNIFGYGSKKELLKESLFSLFPEDTDGKKLLHNLIIRKGKISNYKTKLKKNDGTKFIANLNIDLKDTSDGNHYQGSIEDVTSQFVTESNLKKEIEELQKEKEQNVQMVLQAKHSSNVKTQFLANMSHEIKTPINSVIGFLSLIEKGMFESIDDLKEFAINTRVAVDSLFDIVSNVLDISKIEAGKLELDNIRFNFHEEVAKAKSIITPKAMEKELNLDFDIAKEIPKSLYGDPTRLRQVMVNLLTNSVKNTDNGEVSLTTTIISKSMDSLKLKVSVTDTGRGIPADKLKLLFKPYTQIQSKKGDEKDGTGLGLMISKQFVSLMDGKIEVHSDEGIGTTVEFTCLLGMSATKTATLQSHSNQMEDEIEEDVSIDDLNIVDEKKKDDQVENHVEDDGLPEFHEQTASPDKIDDLKLPDEPKAAEIHAEPQVAEVPELPVEPEVAEVPEIPAEPEVAEVPEIPVEPEVAEVPEIPVEPEVAEVPEIPAEPEVAEVPEIPVEPEVAEVPEIPAEPEVAEVPEIPAEPELPAISAPVKQMPKEKNGKKILLVEDNPISQKVERKILVEFGYDVVTVSNGMEAIEAVEREGFNLILMDIQMPDMDGITATKKIRSFPAPMGIVPIIAVTAHSSMKDREMCLASGMDDYIAKPININFLRMTIEQWITRDHRD